MDIFIQGAACISPQHTFDDRLLSESPVAFGSNRLTAAEPDYTALLDARHARRMSRIIRMAYASARLALKQANLELPDAIVVGTSLGCLEDTGTFLAKMVTHREDMLNPTPFIHSTHNSIAAQIALLTQSKGYNSTYVHRNISFESALLDAALLLEEGTGRQVLAGGVDELTDFSFLILERLGLIKKNSDLEGGNFYRTATRGSIAGEGASFFLLGKQPEGALARIRAIRTVSFPLSAEEVCMKAKQVLQNAGIAHADLLISGHNGDAADDALYDAVAAGLGMSDAVLRYKHLCGEYATASAFALWIAAQILHRGALPTLFGETKDVRHILLHHHCNVHHSLILLSAC